MGLRYVRGLSAGDAERILAARRERLFVSIDDLARRARLPLDTLIALAEAGALEALEDDRRQALWTVHGLSREERPEQLALPLPACEPRPALAALSDFETISWDWRQSSHSTRGHLLEPLRADLSAQGWPAAREVQALPDGARVDYAGIVICRQRPATAKDVTFMTLEDETGFVNLVLWARVYERFRIEAKTLSFMGVSGKIQSEEGVVHLIVERIWRPALQRRPVRSKSRDFH
jgi:error-prone DNA polymerase